MRLNAVRWVSFDFCFSRCGLSCSWWSGTFLCSFGPTWLNHSLLSNMTSHSSVMDYTCFIRSWLFFDLECSSLCWEVLWKGSQYFKSHRRSQGKLTALSSHFLTSSLFLSRYLITKSTYEYDLTKSVVNMIMEDSGIDSDPKQLLDERLEVGHGVNDSQVIIN